MCTSIECDQSIAKKARQAVECQLDLYMGKNKDLTWELKATHYRFARFSKGVRMRATMGEASIVVVKVSVGM